ncbi:MAG: hypothetical protein IJJ65_12130, partial [Butyrivibrio sp.]|nr:hypothetical protein [Butyrivibrio sp.]
MKKNTLDKQLIKALAIGISASMAMQPVTAFAADEGVVNDPATGSSAKEENESKNAQEIEKDLSDEIDAAKKAVDDVKDALDNA